MAGVKQGPKEIDFKPRNGNFMVSFNLEEADLNELVKAISNITGRRFIYGGKLRQIKATVYSPDKVTVQEAYSAFLSILETNGLTVIPHGRFLKIVETPGVVSQTTPIYGAGTAVPAEDRFITRMYRVASVDPNEAANVLGKFKSKEGDITVHPSGNLIIMTDTGSNVQRMIRILEDIDVGGAGDQIWFEPIHYAGANDVAMKLNEILDLKPGAGGKGGARGGAGGGGGGGARILADDRTNSLVITANQPDYMRLLELIKRMDVPQSGEGQMHVLPLQHAGCKDLSGTLNQLLGGAAGAGGGGAAGSRRGAQAAPPVPGSTEDIFEGQVKITCDEGSNKLVVTSSLRDYAALRSVIDELDQPRRQVFIEAVIMDVNIDRNTDVGVRWHMGAPINTGIDGTTDPALAYGGNDILTSLGAPTSPNLASQLGALALGVRGPTINGSNNMLGVTIPAFGVIMNAMATDNDSNVLATPHILATDNIPATIEIGSNIPLQTNVGGSLGALGGLAGAAGAAGAAGGLGGLGLLGGLGGFAAPRQDVGTKIEVTPHVNDSDQVRLELTESISEAGQPQGALGAISIVKRQAKTTLVVRDQQTVVIGGLMRDYTSNGRTKIPILGDIPVLGALFRSTTVKKQKTNLLLVLTPYIIRDQDDLRAIFERKMQERQEFLDRYFIFGDSDWEPPKDYARANGLVEDIRQSQIKMAERARLEEESRPKGTRVHEPGQPIAVPSIAIRGGGDDGGGGMQTATPPPATGGGAPAAPTPRRRPAGA
ncbi:type II secretion system secretin GspD, partial [Polyangium sp. 15x6]|uniref:type II secretion system secretin GspD n=1 Tax=Polyangium sp. 15x6 TaxID=3042687 RepID=UPI00249BB673